MHLPKIDWVWLKKTCYANEPEAFHLVELAYMGESQAVLESYFCSFVKNQNDVDGWSGIAKSMFFYASDQYVQNGTLLPWFESWLDMYYPGLPVDVCLANVPFGERPAALPCADVEMDRSTVKNPDMAG